LPWPARSDVQNAAILLDEIDPEEEEDELLMRGCFLARHLLIRYHDDVVRLADHLLRVNEVDAAEFERLMGIAP
jgi:hypothetical protein